MMNARVLELIRNPEIITSDDLGILESESEKIPYAQSIRAVYLYGIHLYKPELYKENLTKTAAYTTDKKILYQFINSQKNQISEIPFTQKYQEKEAEIQEVESIDNKSIPEKIKESPEPENKEISVKNNFDPEHIIVSEKTADPEFILIDGEKNRLLYEGEENFFNEKTPEIDLEATKESGQIVINKISEITDESADQINNSVSEKNTTEFDKNETVFSQEKIIDEPKISEKEVSAGISFSGIEDFLPEVKFSVPKNHLDYLNPLKNERKSAEEKLIPETEKKIIQEKFSEPIPELGELESTDNISFKHTQSFPVVSSETRIEKENTDNSSIPEEKTEANNSDWQPMQFSSNIPDALIGKNTEIQSIEKQEAKQEKSTSDSSLMTSEKPETERPVFNVSFFGNEVAKIEEKPNAETDNISESNKQSNVGTFINTWQSWLKIDRTAENLSEANPKVKEKIIDDFIEKNPKISQLKEESNFVIKERKEDISHLMTETLAKLYTEQKLYSKAIKAYDILREKHPEKSDYFLERIEEIKEIRKL